MWIEMIMHMSGTRANGEKYPPGWTPFEVADWEGEHLIRGGMAREVERPYVAPPPPLPVPAHAVATAPAPDAEPGSEPEPEPAADAVPPAPSDSKLAWAEYAVSQGLSLDAASRMTKADLMSRYGPRL